MIGYEQDLEETQLNLAAVGERRKYVKRQNEKMRRAPRKIKAFITLG